MSRKRTPSPEQQKEDRKMASSVALACEVLANRNPQSVELKAGLRFIKEFADSPIQQPKPRTRKPKAPLVLGSPRDQEAVHAE
jgi:hypothetical protein